MVCRDFLSASAVGSMRVRLIGEQMRRLAELKYADLQSFWGIKMHLRLDWGRAERSGSGAQRAGRAQRGPAGPFRGR